MQEEYDSAWSKCRWSKKRMTQQMKSMTQQMQEYDSANARRVQPSKCRRVWLSKLTQKMIFIKVATESREQFTCSTYLPGKTTRSITFGHLEAIRSFLLFRCASVTRLALLNFALTMEGQPLSSWAVVTINKLRKNAKIALHSPLHRNEFQQQSLQPPLALTVVGCYERRYRCYADQFKHKQGETTRDREGLVNFKRMHALLKYDHFCNLPARTSRMCGRASDCALPEKLWVQHQATPTWSGYLKANAGNTAPAVSVVST